MIKHYTTIVLASFCLSAAAQIPPYQWGGTIGNAYSHLIGDCLADNNGNMYVAGGFEQANADFDPGPATANLSSTGSSQAFVAKYDTAGAYQWAFKIGNNAPSYIYNMAFAANGDILVCGGFGGNNVDFDPGPGFYPVSAVSGADGFIACYSPAAVLQWVYLLPGQGQQYIMDVQTDAAGNIYGVADFENTVTADPFTSTTFTSFSGSSNMLLIKLNSSGQYLHAGQMGGTSFINAKELTVDNSGNVTVAGNMFQAVDFDPGPGTYNLTAANSPFDLFVASYDSAGSFRWAFNTNTAGTATASGIGCDSNGNIFLAGTATGSADYDPGSGTAMLNADATADGYLVSYDSLGNYRWGFLVAENGSAQQHNDLTVDAAGAVYLTGTFAGLVDFNPGSGIDTIRTPYNGQSNASFTAKYTAAGSYLWAFSICPPPGLGTEGRGEGVAVNSSGNMYIAGFIGNNADFDPSPAVGTVIQNNRNIYIARYGNGCVIPAAPASVNGPASVCSGSSNFYQVPVVPGATAYTWTLPGGWSGTSVMDTITAMAGTTSGVISVTASNACGTSSALTYSVTVVAAPVVSYVQSPPLICDNAQPLLLTSGTPAGGVYGGIGVMNNLFDPASTGPGVFQLWYTYTDTVTGCTTTDSSSITVDICNSIIAREASAVSVYPNPFTDQLIIQCAANGNSMVTIYSADGRLVKQAVLQNGSGIIGTTDMCPGIYFVVMQHDGEEFRMHLVK
jgi:hypothetical protein